MRSKRKPPILMAKLRHLSLDCNVLIITRHHSPKKLRKVNAFSRVGLSVHREGEATCDHYPIVINESQVTWEPQTCSNLFCCTPPPPPVKTCSLCRPDICRQMSGWHSTEISSSSVESVTGRYVFTPVGLALL